MSDHPGDSLPVPSSPIGDQDREIVVRQIQQALARGEVDFDELDDRFGAIYAADTRAELEAVTADLPVPPPPVAPVPGHPMASTGFALFGDIKKSGDFEVEGEITYGLLFGDAVLDLSTSRVKDGTKISTYNLFGDSVVILPDGVRVRRSNMTVFGSQKEDLTPPLPGAPTVTLSRFVLFGDTKVYSLSRVPEGRLRKLWRSFRSK